MKHRLNSFRVRFLTGCSIPVVRAHGVRLDRVRFPAARQNKNHPELVEGWFFCFWLDSRELSG